MTRHAPITHSRGLGSCVLALGQRSQSLSGKERACGRTRMNACRQGGDRWPSTPRALTSSFPICSLSPGALPPSGDFLLLLVPQSSSRKLSPAMTAVSPTLSDPKGCPPSCTAGAMILPPESTRGVVGKSAGPSDTFASLWSKHTKHDCRTSQSLREPNPVEVICQTHVC